MRTPAHRLKRALPLLDAEMWEAPSRLSPYECLDELAADAGAFDLQDKDDDE